MKKSLTLLVFATFIFSIGLVVALWALSEDIREQPGSFLRQYPPHPVVGLEAIKLPNEHYYLAGSTSDRIYLANTIKPLELLSISKNMSDTSIIHLNLGLSEKLRFVRITVTVNPPYYYVMDGAIPYIFRGNTTNWKGELFMKDSTFFIDALPISPGSFAISALSSKTNKKVLGKMEMNQKIKLNHSLLEKQFDGLFDVDGSFSYDKELNKLVYVYFYRNEYIVMDTNLNLDYRANTIDTFKTAQIKTVRTNSGMSIMLSAPPLITNRSFTVYKQWLFVHSLLPARNENMHQFNSASSIDVYNLNSQTYQFSFYIDDDDGEKVRNLTAQDNHLYVLYPRKIRKFALVDKYFSKRL